jgi:anti-sigma B factor antagonist
MRFLPKRLPLKQASDVTVAHFTGCKVSLDDETVHCIHDQLFALADEQGESELLLDFGNVAYVSSSAIDTLVRLRQKLLAKGRNMTVGNLRTQVHEIFVITGVNRSLNLQLAEQETELETQNGQIGYPVGFLVVDDDTAVLSVLEAFLRFEGFKVWLADHGNQAIELYQRHQEEIAVVLLDVQMSGMDGPHTLAALQKLCPTILCCFMTGDPRPYTEEALLQLGAARVFRKPFAFIEIIETLDQLGCRSPWRRQDRWIEIP